MSFKRRVFAGGMTTCLLASLLTGCGDELRRQEPKSIKIGVTLYDQYDTFVAQLMEEFNTYASAKEGNWRCNQY